MKFSAVVIFVVVALAVVNAEEEGEKSLFEKFMSAMKTCRDEAGEDVDMVDCYKTFIDGGDMTTPEFNKCKCAGACLGGKLETMKPDLSWDWDKMADMNEQMKDFDEDMYNENNKVAKACKDQVGGATDRCDAAYKMFDCAAKTSEKVKEKSQMVANMF